MMLRCLGASLLLMGTVCQAQTWTLKWSDEFEGKAGEAPKAENWVYDTGAGGWGNGELQTYCAFGSDETPCAAKQPNAYLDGEGHLVLKASRRGEAWTSARILTKGKHAFQYGRVEARMKLSVGAGFWPAFWMLGADISRVPWPASGEQDIMEWVQKYGPTATSSTVHGPGYSGGKGIGSEYTFPAGGRIDDGFHTYGVVWSENKLEFYRDDPGKPSFTLTPASLPAGTTWVYNKPYFLLLNFAIGGGGFPGKTDASTPATGILLVDWVRVYQPAQ